MHLSQGFLEFLFAGLESDLMVLDFVGAEDQAVRAGEPVRHGELLADFLFEETAFDANAARGQRIGKPQRFQKLKCFRNGLGAEGGDKNFKS